MARTAVVHLVRHHNTIAPFASFMDSYERVAAGLAHELVLLLKGFPDAPAQAPYRERAAAHRPRCLEVSDDGLDLAAYAAAAERLEHDRVCFLNSFSELLAPGWLALLDAALAGGRAGAAGATGSWASQLSWRLYQLGAGGPYARVYDDRRAARAAMHAAGGSTPAAAAQEWATTLLTTARRCRRMARFPAVHLRTNAFLLDRALFEQLAVGRPRTKWAAYELESGRDSITSRLRALGRPPVVVDRHGTVFDAAEWHAADTFWQGDQAGLLVADNQTRSYQEGGPADREALSRYAWGPRARPA